MKKLNYNYTLKLPCKVGDTIYIKSDFENTITPYKVEVITLCSNNMVLFDCNWNFNPWKEGITIDLNDFGKTVFLTVEEYEDKLRSEKND